MKQRHQYILIYGFLAMLVAGAIGLCLNPKESISKSERRKLAVMPEFSVENMLKEDGKYYVIMKAVPKNFSKDTSLYVLNKEEEYYYGRLLLEQRHPVLYDFLLWDLSLCEGIMQSLQQEQTDHTLLRQKEIEERMELIHYGLKYFNNPEQ
jgi:tRNA (adenine22-N1)-methyltransferase